MSYVDDISQCLDQLGENKITEVVRIVDERQFSRDRSPLDFDTAVERLRSCRDIVLGTIENDFFSTLPQGIQGELVPILNSIVSHLNSIIEGSDNLDALGSYVDQMHAFVWRNRLAEKSSRVVNYSQKLDQLTKLAGEAQRLRSEFEELVAKGSEIYALLEQSNQAATRASDAQTQAQTARDQALTCAQEAQTALTTANERNTQINDLLAHARSSQQEISTFEQDLKKLYTEGQMFRDRIAETERTAKETVDKNNDRTKEIQDKLTALEVQIQNALQKATGVSLFHSFQERRNQIAKGKWIWAVLAGIFGVGTIAWVSFLAYTCNAIAPPLYFKLAVALPVTLIVWFCINQYNHERRLEEEYAFKSNISLSLVPYRDLVEEILSKQDDAARNKYAEFIVNSVDKVFTAPIDHKGDFSFENFKHMSAEQLKLLAELVSIVLGKGK